MTEQEGFHSWDVHTRSRIEKYCTYKFLDEKNEGNKLLGDQEADGSRQLKLILDKFQMGRVKRAAVESKLVIVCTQEISSQAVEGKLFTELAT